jgi:hypothetical protein
MFPGNRSITPGIYTKRQNSRADSATYSENEGDQNDNEQETKEIAAYLNLIRKSHDKIKQENMKKKLYLERLKKEFERASEQVQTSEESSEMIEDQIKSVQKQLDQTRAKYKAEMKDLKSYTHVLDRMKKDKIAMEIKANDIQTSLKSTKHVLTSEVKKSQQAREAHFQSKMVLQDLRKSYYISQKKKTEKILNLERELKSREEVAARREDRQKRQNEIAEAAANDDKDSHEVKLRESLLLFKLWFSFLSKKLNSEMKKAVDVERAFLKIKSATGLVDVVEIVERFLTREQSYLVLVKAVSEAEEKLNLLKAENKKAKEMLSSLTLEDSGAKPAVTTTEAMKTLQKKQKNYVIVKEKLKSSRNLYNQIMNWTSKTLLVLKAKKPEDQGNMVEIFNSIFEAVSVLSQQILMQSENVSKALSSFELMKTEDVMNEMRTEDAFNKIIRAKVESPESLDDEHDSGNEARELKPLSAKKGKAGK